MTSILDKDRFTRIGPVTSGVPQQKYIRNIILFALNEVVERCVLEVHLRGQTVDGEGVSKIEQGGSSCKLAIRDAFSLDYLRDGKVSVHTITRPGEDGK